MAEKEIYISGVGKTVLVHSKRAKHINLSIKPFLGIRIAVPLRVSMRQAEMVAHAKAPWLRRHQAQMAEIEQRAIEYDRQNPLIPSAARETIQKRVHQLAAAHGFELGRISVRRQKTRWGSCSSKKNININIRAAQLPDHLMDYLIFHELAHLHVKNHGPKFWEELSRYVPNPRQIDRQLNDYGFLLFLE